MQTLNLNFVRYKLRHHLFKSIQKNKHAACMKRLRLIINKKTQKWLILLTQAICKYWLLKMQMHWQLFQAVFCIF